MKLLMIMSMATTQLLFPSWVVQRIVRVTSVQHFHLQRLKIRGSLRIARHFSKALHRKLAKCQLTSTMALEVVISFLLIACCGTRRRSSTLRGPSSTLHNLNLYVHDLIRIQSKQTCRGFKLSLVAVLSYTLERLCI